MKGMTLIVKEVTKLVAGFIFLYSIYLILYGHLSPGGGFVGGVALACGFILLVLAFGKQRINELIRDRSAALWDCIGALAFLVIALIGYGTGAFFENFLAQRGEAFTLFSGGTIPLSNIAIGIKVGACLAGVFVALAIIPDRIGSDLGGEL